MKTSLKVMALTDFEYKNLWINLNGKETKVFQTEGSCGA